MRLLLTLSLLLSSAVEAAAQIGPGRWTVWPVKFSVQWPTNTAETNRYWFTNNIYHCLVYNNDGAFSAGSSTLPRTEQRFKPDYTNGEIQYQSREMAPANENSYCVFQIHTGDTQENQYGSTTFMLFWFTNDNGSVRDYSGTQLATNLGNQWFQLNVDHNLGTRAIRVWINQQLVWTQLDNGAGDFYFKDGVYEQGHGPTLEIDACITNILLWTNSGQLSVPFFTGLHLDGGTLMLTATNGALRGPYVLQQTTNLLKGTWSPVFTNAFDANGNMDLITNIVKPGLPLSFFRLTQ